MALTHAWRGFFFSYLLNVDALITGCVKEKGKHRYGAEVIQNLQNGED